MTDTSQKITARLQALYSSIQGWQRLEMGGGMFDDAKHMVIAGIRSKNTGLAAKDLKKLLFLRIFGNDFPKHKIERILSHLDGGMARRP